ncbi:hypothetical protein AB0I16_29315 [Streptomyces sp. NPDC050703]|uniref:hypothetical protein n=1 Tax=Streptomyces sp. NPDC050703 TaxID=3157218 RepID=UPI00344329B2
MQGPRPLVVGGTAGCLRAGRRGAGRRGAGDLAAPQGRLRLRLPGRRLGLGLGLVSQGLRLTCGVLGARRLRLTGRGLVSQGLRLTCGVLGARRLTGRGLRARWLVLWLVGRRRRSLW